MEAVQDDGPRDGDGLGHHGRGGQLDWDTAEQAGPDYDAIHERELEYEDDRDDPGEPRPPR